MIDKSSQYRDLVLFILLLGSQAKYGWIKNYPIVTEVTMKWHNSHTLLRYFLPVNGLCISLCLWSIHLIESGLTSHLPAPKGHEATFCYADQETGESFVNTRRLEYTEKMRLIEVLAAIGCKNVQRSSTCSVCYIWFLNTPMVQRTLSFCSFSHRVLFWEKKLIIYQPAARIRM